MKIINTFGTIVLQHFSERKFIAADPANAGWPKLKQTTTTTTPMTTEITPHKKNDIKELLNGEQFKTAVAASLPGHLKPDRFVRVALTALTRTPKLAQCDQASFFQCLLTLSQLGLEPDGRNAHLIPFENRKRNVTECQLIVDYKGLVELAMRSGNVDYIHADKICENDVFEYDKGEIKSHRINFAKPRGKAFAYYAICRFKSGGEKCEVMTRDEVDSIRSRSRAKDNGPWVTDFDEMAKKTVFRRLSKWLQLSPEYRDALDSDADTLEQRRFENAAPVFAKPLFESPPTLIEEEAQDRAAIPETESKQGRRKKEPIHEQEMTPIQKLERLCAVSRVTKEKLVDWLREQGEEFEGGFESIPDGLAERTVKAWPDILERLQF